MEKLNLLAPSQDDSPIQYIEVIASDKVVAMIGGVEAIKNTKLADGIEENKFLEPPAKVVFGLFGRRMALIQLKPKLTINYETSM